MQFMQPLKYNIPPHYTHRVCENNFKVTPLPITNDNQLIIHYCKFIHTDCDSELHFQPIQTKNILYSISYTLVTTTLYFMSDFT